LASRRRRKLDIPKSPSLQRSPPFCGGGGERGDRGRSREGAPLAVSSRRARPRVPGPRLLADSGLDSPAGLQRRVALGQDLEAALEKPYVPVPQEIQALSHSPPAARPPWPPYCCGSHFWCDPEAVSVGHAGASPTTRRCEGSDGRVNWRSPACTFSLLFLPKNCAIQPCLF
jgi:hypothetical protein